MMDALADLRDGGEITFDVDASSLTTVLRAAATVALSEMRDPAGDHAYGAGITEFVQAICDQPDIGAAVTSIEAGQASQGTLRVSTDAERLAIIIGAALQLAEEQANFTGNDPQAADEVMWAAADLTMAVRVQ